MVEPLDLTALFKAGMAFMAALNLVLARVMFSRHCGMPEIHGHSTECVQLYIPHIYSLPASMFVWFKSRASRHALTSSHVLDTQTMLCNAVR